MINTVSCHCLEIQNRMTTTFKFRAIMKRLLCCRRLTVACANFFICFYLLLFVFYLRLLINAHQTIFNKYDSFLFGIKIKVIVKVILQTLLTKELISSTFFNQVTGKMIIVDDILSTFGGSNFSQLDCNVKTFHK